jgi:hypothetical protein
MADQTEPDKTKPKTRSKFKIFIHRSVGLLGCLMISGITARYFYLHEYIWAWMYTALMVFILYNFIRNFFRPEPNYGGYYSCVFWGLWACYHEYSNYKRDLRLEKYGVVYNKTRQSLGIPIIPANWHTELPGNTSIEWKGKEGVLGHEKKYIALDSLYKIEFERDEYNFKGIGDTSRTISILFDYARGRSKDSIHYWYNLKDTTLDISRRQADSLFNVAKIRKDY